MFGNFTIKYKDNSGKTIFREILANEVVNNGENFILHLDNLDPALDVKDGETILIGYDFSTVG